MSRFTESVPPEALHLLQEMEKSDRAKNRGVLIGALLGALAGGSTSESKEGLLLGGGIGALLGGGIASASAPSEEDLLYKLSAEYVANQPPKLPPPPKPPTIKLPKPGIKKPETSK